MDSQKISQEYGLSIDEVRARWLTLRVALWKSDLKRFCKEVIKIRSKEGLLVPLVFNEAQLMLHQAAENMLEVDRWVRLIGCKARREGFSTYVAARGYWRATLWDRQRIYILSHEMASSNALFDMVGLMQEKHPFPPAVGTDNAKTLEFVKRGSEYTVATAGQKAGGRGGAVSFFHGSEAAWWTNARDHFAASVQSVDEVKGVLGVLWRKPKNPLPFEKDYDEIVGWVQAPSEVYLESTSAGPTGEFYHRYKDAVKSIGRYRSVFVPWVVQKEYKQEGDFVPQVEPEEDGGVSEAEYQTLHKLRNEQMLWRREKIHELGSLGRFMQEFPINSEEAFSAADIEGLFIKPSIVLKARKRAFRVPDAPLIVGVDAAGAGGDRFCIAGRRGDVCLWIKSRMRLEHDDAVAWISQVIEEENPQRVFIDRGAMGANIISSLRNIKMSYASLIRGIDFGGKSWAKKALPDKSGPFNVRAEIYARLRDWLIEGGTIPDDDELASDLSATKIKYRANNDWLLESKSDMKARGVRSPDNADALALTFSALEFFAEWSKPKQQIGFDKGITKTGSIVNAQLSLNPHGWMA